jgi:hypothetical protein
VFDVEKTMSPEERQLLQGLFDRIRGGAASPRDREAENFIADNVRQQPYAPYLLAQTVIVQDQALRAANERLQQLETQIQDYQRQAEPPQQPGSGGFLSGIGALFGGGAAPQAGFGSGVPQSGFGGGAPQAAPPPPRPWSQAAPQNNAPPSNPGPGYPPQGGYPPLQSGPWSGQPAPSGGGGFLHGALGAAAGVAGGVLLADSIRGLFGGHNNGLGIASGFGGGGLGQGGFGGGETVVNNYYGDDPGAAAGYQQDAGYQDADDQQDIGSGLDDFPDSDDTSSV